MTECSGEYLNKKLYGLSDLVAAEEMGVLSFADSLI